VHHGNLTKTPNPQNGMLWVINGDLGDAVSTAHKSEMRQTVKVGS
jgi:hypothetical protein